MAPAPPAETMPLDDCWNRIGVWGSETPRCPVLDTVVHCHNCEVFSRAALRLHDRRVPVGYREAWTEQYSAPITRGQQGHDAAVAFRLGEEWFAIPTRSVSEVMPVLPVHSLPHRPTPLLRGIVAVRGRMQLCVSLHDLLEVEVRPAEEERRRRRRAFPRMLVISRDDDAFVFGADEVLGTVRYAANELGEAPATLPRPVAMHHKGMLETAGHRIGCLDDELLMYTLVRSVT